MSHPAVRAPFPLTGPLTPLTLLTLLALGGCEGISSDYSESGTSGPFEGPNLDAGVAAPDDGAEGSPEVEPGPEGPPFNPFVKTAHDPFSTFAVDVDTASYQYFRNAVKGGWLPEPNYVRLEDFVNYFDYDYAIPDPNGEIPFAITLAAAPHPLGRKVDLLRVGIAAKDLGAFEKRPTNLVFLVDVSGSMNAPNKLPVVKELLLKALDVLDPTDTVSIVTYAGSTRVALAPTEAKHRENIEAIIQSFGAGGGTAGGPGMALAYEQAEVGFIEGGINHVIMCTDGDFNVGISGTDQIVDFIEEKRESGITLTAVGFGTDNLNDDMMEKVSNAGNGVYAFISDADEAVKYAQTRMLGSLYFVAKDMKVQVEFNPAHVLAYRLLGYENRAIADDDFRDDRIDAGEIGLGHRVTALYEVVRVGSAIPEAESIP
ncbi:MAG: von Willebrand factor type A domain-containing protein, partial [Myxococcales bacterium]|nr:von Willebrand factor type A domain-containing protein [Myxococcales bacterium]